MTKTLVHRLQVPSLRIGSVVRSDGTVYELSSEKYDLDNNSSEQRVWYTAGGRLDRLDSTLLLPAEVLWEPEPEPINLPTEPGTVIAIGEWWFVRLRPYKPGITPAWELLPAPEDVEDKARRNGFPSQCIYPDDIVLGEINQEGAFRIVAAPEEPAE